MEGEFIRGVDEVSHKEFFDQPLMDVCLHRAAGPPGKMPADKHARFQLSLSYLTIVGAYVVKGGRHDATTLVDLAVVDPVTRSLVLRAGGTDARHGDATLIEQERQSRLAASSSFNAATDRLIENFDRALAAFEADVRAGKANVRVAQRSQGAEAGGGMFTWGGLLGLFLLAAVRRRKICASDASGWLSSV